MILSEYVIPFVTLLMLEIILGIDNVIFIAILSNKLESVAEQERARKLGIGLAVVSRLLLLFTIKFIIDNLTSPIIDISPGGLSGKDLILLVGGLFLIGKSTYEIHEKLEGHEGHGDGGSAKATLTSILIQIIIIDVVFSLDSVITAIGVAENLWIMGAAIMISAAVMVFASGAISTFVEEHPTFKILALAFLILIGAILVIEGWDHHVAEDIGLKGYVYFAMAFSIVIEVINMQFRGSSEKVKLKNPRVTKEGDH